MRLPYISQSVISVPQTSNRVTSSEVVGEFEKWPRATSVVCLTGEQGVWQRKLHGGSNFVNPQPNSSYNVKQIQNRLLYNHKAGLHINNKMWFHQHVAVLQRNDPLGLPTSVFFLFCVNPFFS